MDKPLRNALILLAVIVIVETCGVSLYLLGHTWGMIVSVGFASLIQGIMLVLIWYTFKVVFHLGNDVVRMNKNTANSGSEKDTDNNSGQ
jgi:hypothetical protein